MVSQEQIVFVPIGGSAVKGNYGPGQFASNHKLMIVSEQIPEYPLTETFEKTQDCENSVAQADRLEYCEGQSEDDHLLLTEEHHPQDLGSIEEERTNDSQSDQVDCDRGKLGILNHDGELFKASLDQNSQAGSGKGLAAPKATSIRWQNVTMQSLSQIPGSSHDLVMSTTLAIPTTPFTIKSASLDNSNPKSKQKAFSRSVKPNSAIIPASLQAEMTTDHPPIQHTSSYNEFLPILTNIGCKLPGRPYRYLPSSPFLHNQEATELHISSELAFNQTRRFELETLVIKQRALLTEFQDKAEVIVNENDRLRALITEPAKAQYNLRHELENQIRELKKNLKKADSRIGRLEARDEHWKARTRQYQTERDRARRTLQKTFANGQFSILSHEDRIDLGITPRRVTNRTHLQPFPGFVPNGTLGVFDLPSPTSPDAFGATGGPLVASMSLAVAHEPGRERDNNDRIGGPPSKRIKFDILNNDTALAESGEEAIELTFPALPDLEQTVNLDFNTGIESIGLAEAGTAEEPTVYEQQSEVDFDFLLDQE